MDDRDFQKYTQTVDALVQRVHALPDGGARTTALELLQSVMGLHGAALSRIVELLSASGDSGQASLTTLSNDPLICGLLVLYGIHPLAIEERVQRALERLKDSLQKYNARTELLEISESGARISLRPEAHGYRSSPEKLRSMVEQAVLESAPELNQVTIEGLTSSTFVPVNMIQVASREETTYEKSPA
jgi:hypothetical protein